MLSKFQPGERLNRKFFFRDDLVVEREQKTCAKICSRFGCVSFCGVLHAHERIRRCLKKLGKLLAIKLERIYL